MPYPEGTPNYTRYTINEYNTVAHRIKPPFTTIVKYDLNQPAIKWQVPFGDDPTLAARGITGTGAPAVNNGLIITESGLIFGAGRDNQIRAWDSDSGKQLWSARFGGNPPGRLRSIRWAANHALMPRRHSAGGRGGAAAARRLRWGHRHAFVTDGLGRALPGK
jgi:outer membrane protein assembly factor BamB